MIVDCFPFHDELDILEMRLTELFDVVDRFVIVEADVTHQDKPKPAYYREHADRFAAFADKIVAVWATGLPTLADNPDPWAREYAQREHIAAGLAQIGIGAADLIMQSDVDEIPSPLHVRNCRPGNALQVFGQRGHFWAVDWLHPHVWHGTVIGRPNAILRMGSQPFGAMRGARGSANMPDHMVDAGWHFSWLGGPDRTLKKVDSFCHPEVRDEIVASINTEHFYWREGWHVDKCKMSPVDVNDEWPRWIVDGNAPASWYRPR